MLPRARHRAEAAGVALPLVRADALRLPFRAGTFDGVAGHSFLYLLPDPGAGLAEAHRVVKRGGRVAFLEPRAGVPDPLAVWAGGAVFGASMLMWRVMSGLHRRWDERGACALLERCGFSEARAWPVLAGWGVMMAAKRR